MNSPTRHLAKLLRRQHRSTLTTKRERQAYEATAAADDDDDAKTILSEPSIVRLHHEDNGAAEVLLETWPSHHEDEEETKTTYSDQDDHVSHEEEEDDILAVAPPVLRMTKSLPPFALPKLPKFFRNTTPRNASANMSQRAAKPSWNVHARDDGTAEVVLPETQLTESIHLRRTASAPTQASTCMPRQTFHLLILQGHNLLSSSNAQPICRVLVQDENNNNHHHGGSTTNAIGETPPGLVDALNPHNSIYGGEACTFCIQGTGKTKICIQLIGDNNRQDDMPKVEFTMDQVVAGRNNENSKSRQSPNRWVTFQPPLGQGESLQHDKQKDPQDNQQDHLPRLQIRLIQTSRRIQRYCSNATLTTQNLEWHSRVPVSLHVYDVTQHERVQEINNYLKPLGMGGIFHASVEVYGREYSFGGASSLPPDQQHETGIFLSRPKQCPGHHYRETLHLGACELTERQVRAIVRDLKPRWMALQYNIFRKNCCHFARALAIELGVGDLPRWTYSFAETVEPFEPVLRGIADNKPQPLWRDVDDLADDTTTITTPTVASLVTSSQARQAQPELTSVTMNKERGVAPAKSASRPLQQSLIGKSEPAGFLATSRMRRSFPSRRIKVSTIVDWHTK